MKFMMALLLLVTAAGASATQNALQELNLVSYKLSSAYASYIFFEGSRKYQQQADQYFGEGVNLLTEVTDAAELRKHWQKAGDFMNENKAGQTSKYANVSLETGWNLLFQEFQTVMDARLKGAEPVDPKDALELMLEKIRLQYMQFANAPTGGFGVIVTGTSIDEKVAQADKMIDEYFSDDLPLTKKWGFIRKTILAYNSEVAPFIVTRVLDDMQALLNPAEN